jgi:hypothetical protein
MAEMMNKLRQGLIRMTKLDQVIRQQMALSSQVGGIQTHFSATDDLVGDLAVIEETLSQFNLITRMHRERRMRYRDYEAMDNYGDVSVALDIYAEEATQNDLVKDTNLWVTGDDKVVQILESFFEKQRIRTQVYGFARTLAKYGDLFVSVRYDVNGISSLLYLPPDYVERIGLGVDKVKYYKLENQLKQVSPRKDGMLLPWECVHFRLLSFGFSTIYGRAIIEAARKRWLHLKLLEDAVAIYRLNRAVERLIFYIDVGSASPSESLRIVNQYKRKFGNKRSYVDPSTQTFEQQYDPHNMLENIFWPVNSATERSRIEKLNPPPEQGQLQDLDHFNQKLFVALGIPKDFLTGEVTGTWNSRESLALQDVRFSRKLHRLQQAVLEGLETLCRFHLAIVLGDADAAQSANFQLHMSDISKVARQQYDQVLLNRAQLMTVLNDMSLQMNLNREVWLYWIFENYFPDLPKDLISHVIIPDAELSKASMDIAQANQPPPAATAKPKAKPKKKANESVRELVLKDIDGDKRGVLKELLEEYTPPEDSFSQTLIEKPKIEKEWLTQLVESYSRKKSNNTLTEES